MHVHIVCPDDKHIIPRMMGWLATENGWSISEHVDPSADALYFAPYLACNNRFPEGPLLTGWFTHYESRNHGKTNTWKKAAQHFDLRLFTAPVYGDMLRAQGPATQILPGADHKLFKLPRGRKKRGQIGVAHVRSIRKGPHLVDALDIAHSDKLLVLDGRRRSLIPYEEMPAFYGELGVYVCTSDEEGIPAPLLEAMLCGANVVAPIDVGIEPLLRGLPGVFSYAVGDSEAMLGAVDLALESGEKPKSIRDAALPFSVELWAHSNRAAIEGAING